MQGNDLWNELEIEIERNNRLRVGQIIEDLSWSVLDSDSGEIEEKLATLARQIQIRCSKKHEDGGYICPQDQAWYAGQLMGMAAVMHSKLARAAALRKNPLDRFRLSDEKHP